MIAGGSARAKVATGLVSLFLFLASSPVAAHTGEGVSLEHVIIEVGTWGLAVTAVIAGVVGIFWFRARRSGR